MRCFVHREAEAVAICKACFKGICADCVVPAGTAVACSPACAATVAEIQRLVAVSGRHARATQRTQAALFGAMGVGTGIAAVIATDVGRWVMLAATVLLGLGAIRFYRLASRFRDPGK